MQVPILVVGDVSGRYVSGIESQRGPVSVVRHVHDLGEMLGIAQSGIARAVLLVTQYEDLTHSMLSSLQSMDIAVCALADAGESVSFPQLVVIDSLADIGQVISKIQQAVDAVEKGEHRSATAQENTSSSNPKADETKEPPHDSNGEGNEDQAEALRGAILTVWGPQGAPGRTTVAVNLAGLAANTGLKVCLLDADTYGASVGAVLGLSDDYSSLAQLCHYADRGNLTVETVQELVSTIKHRNHQLDVITGLNRPDRWAEVRGKALAEVLNMLRSMYDVIIIDTSFCIEQDEALAFDGLAPLRNDGTLTSLFEADHILVIGAADVVGVPRTIKAVESLSTLLSDTMRDVAWSVFFNRVRSEAIGANPVVALEHAWERFGPASTPISGLIADDRPTADKAWITGKTAVEVAPKSQLVQDLTAAYSHLVSVLKLHTDETSEHLGAEEANQSKMVEKKKQGFFAQLRGR